MNSRADPGDGFFRAPLENQTQQEFQFMGSWVPVTPGKPLQGRSSLIVDENLDLNYAVEGMPFCNNGAVQDLNYAVQGIDQNGVYDQRVTNRNRMINNLAGSYAQARGNTEREDLLGRSHAASLLAPVVRNITGSVEPPFNGNFTSDAGMVNGSFTQSGTSQDGYTGFELDDLLDPDKMPFSFTSLLSGGDNLFQVPQYGTPACSRPLYNLNSPPRKEAVGSVCESSFQCVPSTPTLCRTGQENGFQEKMMTTTEHEITGEKSDRSMQSIVDSSAVNSTEVIEQKDGSGQNDLGFDLNKTPQQKPSKRKKKFLPKVVVEGKPKRKPRKPATQENVKAKEIGSGKRKKAQKTNLKESATKNAAIVGDMSNPIPKITRKSCRKALNFDLEKAGDEGQGDSESEIVQNASGSNSFSETRDATGGTTSSFLDLVTQMDQTSGLMARNQPLEASMRNQPDKLSTGANLPRVSEEHHIQMKNQLIGFPFNNQQPRMIMTNQQPHLAMGNQQPMHLIGAPRPALASGNQQPGGIQGNRRPIFLNQQTQQTCLPAGNQQYGPPRGMQQLVVSTGGQQHGQLMNNQQPAILLRNQRSEFVMRNQQLGSSIRSQQPCVPSMNHQPGTQNGFTHLNQMAAAYMPSPGLQPHSQSQTSATNLHVESVSRSSIETAGTCQRSSIPEYDTLQQDIRQGNGYIPFQRRSQKSSLPTPIMAKRVEARGSKRQYDRAMGQMQNHGINSVGGWRLLPEIAQSQDVERQGAEYFDAAKKMKVQKAVQEKLHGMPHEVIEIEDDPTDGARKDKHTASINETASKGIPSLAQSSADNEKCIVPETPARKGRPGRKKSVTPKVPAGRKKSVTPKVPAERKKSVPPKVPAVRKKSVPPPAHTTEIQLWEPTLAKTPSSRNKAKEKGKKSIQDSGNSRGPSGELLSEDSIAEIIYRLQNIYLGDTSREQEQNALVLYKGDGAIVPYETKKRKPRPKVDLDDETTRIWNLLMGKGESDEAMDKKKEKWWEEERRVFRGRADSFIARMHLVQGDRRFSPWKGSVVDSVIGVFLTQNVTDHLSSSAFMSLAARFPPKSNSNREDERNIRSVVVEDPEGCILNLNDTPSWQEMVQNPSSDTQISGVDSGSKEQQKELEEEVLSSQDSCDPATFQSCGRVGSCSGSKSDAEFSPARSETKTVSGSAQSVQTGSPNSSDEICLPLQYERSGDVQIQETANVAQKKADLDKTMNWKDSLSFGQPSNHTNWQKGPTNPSTSYIQQPQILDIEDYGKQDEGMGYSWLSVSPKVNRGKNKKARVVKKGGNSAPEFTGQITPSTPHETPGMRLSASSSTTHQGDQQNDKTDLLNSSEECLTRQSSTTQNITRSKNASLQNILVESDSSSKEQTAIEYNETNATIVREMKGTLADGKKPTSHWDNLRKDAEAKKGKKERSKDSMDSIDYEAIRRASVKDISDAIKERGMNNMLAVRIKDFLDRIVKDHGAIDLEWLRDVPADKVKDYLLSIRGLGLKSVECVRLLTLQNLAFPVDTNVGRIAVRLGWVPLQPLPESLQLHLLELYPVLESIQKYLWPRLCKLDQRTLYELHYQLITFGKVFCTKSKPNCNACPMRGECRHFASAYASARLSLPAPEERSLTTATVPVPPESFPPAAMPMMALPSPLEKSLTMEAPSNRGNCEPIIEMPASPEPEPEPQCTELTASDIEYAYYNDDPDEEIPPVEVSIKELGMTIRDVVRKDWEIQEGDMSRALVTLNPTSTFIPTPKIKNISRLRTEHQVYELPDSHRLLVGMDRREPDDPSPYLLAIWTPGETANSAQPPELRCGGQASGKMCFDETCSECNSVREAKSQTVRGTLLIPCRTATRGSFPLNGTYFQVNEMFADHESSLEPINVPRDWIWNLPRRTVYFGTSVTSIFRGLSTEQIQYCFWKGFVCVRGFDQKLRAPRPLMARLHFPASKAKTNKT